MGNDVVMARPFKAPFRAPSSSANAVAFLALSSMEMMRLLRIADTMKADAVHLFQAQLKGGRRSSCRRRAYQHEVCRHAAMSLRIQVP